MEIWPAIDLRGGKCVRLQQGDYQRETVFGDDPAEMARRWVAEGAQCLHLVDLDGARDGIFINRPAVTAILAAVDVPCEFGGGIRDEATIRLLLDLGMARLVIGTRAVEDPAWLRKMCRAFPHRLVLGIDARDGQVATNGWLEVSNTSAVKLGHELCREPIAAIVYTDIARDGMLAGPNFSAMAEMKRAVSAPVIASGGVSSLDDIEQLATIGMDGCIIGRALYDGKFRLAEAIRAADGSIDDR